MKYRSQAVGVAIAVILAAVGSPTMAAESTGPIKSGWDESGSTVDTWRQHPESGAWTAAPVGESLSDPYIYKYKHVCRNDPQLDGSNCAGPEVACTEAKDGRPVNWYRSLADITPAVWQFFAGPTCVYTEKPVNVLDQIAGAIQKRFETLPVDAGVVVAQPSPHTLRGAETNFYADAKEQQFDITMFGQKVHVVATPVQYTWNYGDGTVLGPQPSMGGPLPQDRWGEKTKTSHTYGATGDFQVVMTTSFRGTYSVNDGPPLPIPGEGQFSAAPQTISVWRSITRNYADDCNVNPNGQGCPGS